MHGDYDDTRLRRPAGAAHAADRRREARPQLVLDPRCALGPVRPCAPRRGPLPAVQGTRAGSVLRGARREGNRSRGRARRLRLVRLAARLPPGSQAGAGSRDLERLAGPRPRHRGRGRADRPSGLLPGRRCRAGRRLELGGRAIRRPGRTLVSHSDRRGQRLLRARMARRHRAALHARGLDRAAGRRPRPRGARGGTATRSGRDTPALRGRGGEVEMTAMRERFYELAREALEDDERVAVVTAQIGNDSIGEHPRHFDVGIREQLMIGVAAGLALEGYRPVAHSYTPFLVERPWEFLKLDLGHNDLGVVLVSTGASYDAARSGRTHQAPEDVALVASLPGWTIHVPGHVDEAERLFRQALGGDGRTYLRLSEET